MTAPTAAQSAKLQLFCTLVRAWHTNLVSAASLAALEHRHVADCLQLLPLIDRTGGNDPIVDLGSGAGFPGLVVAICRQQPVTLVESQQKKARFLRHAIQSLDLEDRVTVHGDRIETLRLTQRSLITARAVAALPQLLAYAHMIAGHHDCMCLFLKGRSWKNDVAMAKEQWHFALDTVQSKTDRRGRILLIDNIRRNNP